MKDHGRVNVVTITTFISAVFAIAVSIHYFWPIVFPPSDVELRLERPPTCEVKTAAEGQYEYYICALIGLGARKGEQIEIDSVWVETALGDARFDCYGTETGAFRWPISIVWNGAFLITSEKQVNRIEGCIKAQTCWGIGSVEFEVRQIEWQ
jgi:hypothetical protein